jgi:hypothetical protein
MTNTPRYNFGYDGNSRYAVDPYAENKDFNSYAMMQAPKEFSVSGAGRKDTSSIDSSTMDAFEAFTNANNASEAAIMNTAMTGIQTQNQVEQAKLNAEAGASSSGGGLNSILDAAGTIGGLFKGFSSGGSSSNSNSGSSIRMAGDRISNLNIFG